jgi:hypothetical protein
MRRHTLWMYCSEKRSSSLATVRNDSVAYGFPVCSNIAWMRPRTLPERGSTYPFIENGALKNHRAQSECLLELRVQPFEAQLSDLRRERRRGILPQSYVVVTL